MSNPKWFVVAEGSALAKSLVQVMGKPVMWSAWWSAEQFRRRVEFHCPGAQLEVREG